VTEQAKDVDSFLDELAADEDYQQLRARLDAEHEAVVRRNAQDSRAVVADLRTAGFDVEWVDDLYSGEMVYASAGPLLLSWLPRMRNPDVLEGIVRALSVSWFRPQAGRPLVHLLRSLLDEPDWLDEPDAHRLRWTVANALDVVAGEDVVDDLLELHCDARLDDDTRSMLVRALATTGEPRVVPAILAVTEQARRDDDVPLLISCVIALGRLRHEPSLPLLEEMCEHADRELRSEAKKALRAVQGRRRAR
jgi:HEAT repeat protein